ncbi:hypothetical protein J32TS6_38350 [Virgibacillus pantothenticus]|nr:hypothetical protein J32TS6_38350 [Virgibacillus pantothenticus]
MGISKSLGLFARYCRNDSSVKRKHEEKLKNHVIRPIVINRTKFTNVRKCICMYWNIARYLVE